MALLRPAIATEGPLRRRIKGRLVNYPRRVRHRCPLYAVAVVVKIKEGIDWENARKIIDLVKGSKIKVQASIHEDTVRVTGKNRDDLQSVMKLLKAEDLPFEVQFTNFRE